MIEMIHIAPGMVIKSQIQNVASQTNIHQQLIRNMLTKRMKNKKILFKKDTPGIGLLFQFILYFLESI
jgi:hypothetical protein